MVEWVDNLGDVKPKITYFGSVGDHSCLYKIWLLVNGRGRNLLNSGQIVVRASVSGEAFKHSVGLIAMLRV